MLRYALFAAAVTVPSAAHSDSGAAAGIRIVLNVPEICQIEASIAPVDPKDGVARGNVFEMCNSGRGYRVIASHRSLAVGEAARIEYAGKTSALTRSGLTEIALRMGPNAKNSPVIVQTEGLQSSLAISLGILAI